MKHNLPLTLLLLFLFNTPAMPWSVSTDSAYISPNHDGYRDIVTFTFSQPKKQYVSNWRLEIKNRHGKVVRSYHADKRKKIRGLSALNIFRSDNDFFTPRLQLPKRLVWNGTDDQENPVPNGSYRYSAYYTSLSGEETLIKEEDITLDAEGPQCNLSTEQKIIAPQGRGREKYIKIIQKADGAIADNWTGEWKDITGKTVAAYKWTSRNVPASVTWNGRKEKEGYHPEGYYSYHLAGSDEAGNSCSSVINNILITGNNLFVDIHAATDTVKAGPKEPLVFYTDKSYRLSVKSWDFIIYHQKKEKREIFYSQTGSRLPGRLEWDGKNRENKILKPGKYLYKLVLHDNEKSTESEPRSLEITNLKMKYSFRINHNYFTPDGDGVSDTLVIFPTTTRLKPLDWKLELHEFYGPDNKSSMIVREWKGHGRPGKIFWNGIKSNGMRIGSAASMKLLYMTTDELGREIRKTVLRFKTGMNVYRQNGHYRISVPENRVNESFSWLRKAKRIIKKYPGYKVELQSHSSQPGDNDSNLLKTEQRAKKLFGKLYRRKLSHGRYNYRGVGELDPLINEEDNYAFNKNRRVDFILEER